MKQDIKSVSFEQLDRINEVDIIISDEPLHTLFDFFQKSLRKILSNHDWKTNYYADLKNKKGDVSEVKTA